MSRLRDVTRTEKTPLLVPMVDGVGITDVTIPSDLRPSVLPHRGGTIWRSLAPQPQVQDGEGSAEIVFTGSGIASAGIEAIGSAGIIFSASGQGSRRAAGVGAGTVQFSGSADAERIAGAVGVALLTFSGIATDTALRNGGATGTVTFSATGNALRIRNGSSSALMQFSASAAGDKISVSGFSSGFSKTGFR